MQTEVCTQGKLTYLLRYPNGYEAGKRYPVLFFLHGAGGRGTDVEVLRGNPYFRLTDPVEEFPFITVAPLCSANTWFDLFEELEELVRRIACADFTDLERIYCMGASMGGYATWQLAMSLPEYFAAIVPICGGGMYWNASRLVNVPVWAFHGAKDTVVFTEESRKMVDAVNKKQGHAKLTIYPENAHDAWSDTYSNPEVFAWLLSHTNQNAKQLIESYVGSKQYG